MLRIQRTELIGQSGPVDLLREPAQLMSQVDQVHQLEPKQIALRCLRTLSRSHPKTPDFAGPSAIILQYQSRKNINNSL